MLDSKVITFVFERFHVRSSELPALDFNDLSEYESSVLSFAKDWISKKQQFEFQTSGSTGTPRKIIFQREQIKESVRLTKDFFQLKQGHKALLCLDPNFVAGKMMLIRALEIGMNLYCLPPAANPMNTLDEEIDFAAFVPYQLEAIINSTSANKIVHIKTGILGGSPVSQSIIEKIQALETQFYETYGMTETLTHIAIRKLNPVQPDFHTLPGVKISLDERGCIGIRAKHLSNEMIQTNDVAILRDETSFRITGRYDNVINSAGVKISPELLESKIETIVKKIIEGPSYFIAGVADPEFGQKVMLYIETDTLSLETENQLMAELKSKLKKWEVPKAIVAIPQFTRTNSGKINRVATLSN